ncbi:MAG TPA: hypothetical protein PLW48_09210 [Alphaproteobacteria bacterium]|nr:hypothetical protein [Rhodospirillaceae bacterium]HRJ67302.1 hypothetical protein [Alphaproteobacteria bacterium]
MSFNYKDLGDSLRRKFAGVAAADDMLRRVAFEEAMSDRHGGAQPSFVQSLLNVLDTNVPNIKPEVLTAAMLLPMPRGMMNEHRGLDGVTPETKDLYLLMMRNQNPAFAATQSPEAAQLAMTFLIVNAEQMEETRRTQYVPYAQFMRMASDMATLKSMLDGGMVSSGAPQLDKLFADTAQRIDVAAKDFFNAPQPGQKPPRP